MCRCKTSFGIFFNKASLRSVYPPSDMSPAAEDAATAAGRFKIFFTADAGLAIPFFLPFDCLAGFLQGLASRFSRLFPFISQVPQSRDCRLRPAGLALCFLPFLCLCNRLRGSSNRLRVFQSQRRRCHGHLCVPRLQHPKAWYVNLGLSRLCLHTRH